MTKNQWKFTLPYIHTLLQKHIETDIFRKFLEEWNERNEQTAFWRGRMGGKGICSKIIKV